MKRTSYLCCLFAAGLAVLLIAIIPSHGGSLSVTGTNQWAQLVYEYPNPFDPNLDRNPIETTFTVSNGWAGSMANAVNRTDQRAHSGNDGRLTRTGSVTPGPPTWCVLRAPGMFTARTLVVLHTVWTGFSSAQPLTIKFGTGASPDWASIPASYTDSGLIGRTAFVVANLLVRADSMRLEYSETALYNNVHYADLHEIFVLPHTLLWITNVSAVASITTWGAAANLVDRQDDGAGWAAQAPGQKTVTFTFDRARPIGAICVYSFENVDAVFSIKDGSGTAVASVSMTIGPRGWAAPICFASPLSTSSVVFDFETVADAALREVIFLEAVPATGTVILVQ